MTPPILVSGAAGGRQGATGRHVARMLRHRAAPVRVLVHRLDERSASLRALGTEVIEGDLLDLRSVRAAMSGVRRAYFTYPVQAGLLEATAVFAAAAREAGVEQVVNLSQHLQRAEQPTPHQRQHWLSERIFDWAQVGAVHLEATVFFENVRALARRSLAAADALLLPWGPATTLIPLVSAEDVARVAVGVLTGPPLANGTILPLLGEALTIQELVEAFSALLNKPVRYQEITDEQWRQAATGADINPHALEHLSHLWRHLRTRSAAEQRGYRVSEAIAEIGGATPKRFRQFLQEQAGAFTTA